MERPEASEMYCKRAPRIISRGRLRSVNASGKKEKECFKNDCEVDDEVGEGFVVRGGVMMRTADVKKEQLEPMKLYYIDVDRSQTYQHAEACNVTFLDDEASSSRVTVEVSSLSGDRRLFHICDNLPGVANEVESYPCPYCPNRIFLTSFGLERHSKMEHKTQLPEVMKEISRIHDEWRRRDAFKAIAKNRRETLKKTRILTEVVRRSQNVEFEDLLTNKHFTSALCCPICGLSFDADCEFMMGHFCAHRKNDDLRRRLLKNFGPSHVARCTCHQCHFVFVSEKNLMQHKQSSHSRKRKYICKWCGDVCLSMNELNVHKKNVHRVLCNRAEKSSGISTFGTSKKHYAKRDFVGADDNSMEVQELTGNGFTDASSSNRASMLNQNPCITKCSECDLVTVKPSLLIRHMQRVHNKNCFSAVIEVKGLPNIRVDMYRGKVTWWCCNISFEDRFRFIRHRKTFHKPVLECIHLRNCPISAGEQIIASNKGHKFEAKGTSFMSSGQTAQLIKHEETLDDDLYVLMAGDDREQKGENTLQEVQTDESIVECGQQITLTPREFMQLREHVCENFDGALQIFLVDNISGTKQQSPVSGVEPSIDFNTNTVVDNDVLSSLLISSIQMSATGGKYSAGTHPTESAFLVGNVSDYTEENVSPLPRKSLINVVTNPSGQFIPTITFNPGSLVDNAINCDFQVQRNTLHELTPVSAISISHSGQQFDETSSSQYLSTAAVREDTISSFINQDTNSTAASVCNPAAYNLALEENDNRIV